MLRGAKYIGLAVAILIGLGLGQAYGPMNSLPSIVRVDEHYLAVVRNHALLLGFSASLAACIANLLLRISHLRVLLTLAIVAAKCRVAALGQNPSFYLESRGRLVPAASGRSITAR